MFLIKENKIENGSWTEFVKTRVMSVELMEEMTHNMQVFGHMYRVIVLN